MADRLPTPVPLRKNFFCSKITAMPEIEVIKNEVTTGPYTEGDTITYEVSVINTGERSLSGSVLVDSLSPLNVKRDPLGLFEGGVCITPGWVTRVVYDYTVTIEDLQGPYITNIACLSSDMLGSLVLQREDEETPVTTEALSSINLYQTPNVACDGTRSVLLQPAIADINKTVISTGPYTAGDSITYRIDVHNIGGSNLEFVRVLDTQQTSINIVSDIYNLFGGNVTIPPDSVFSTTYDYVVTTKDMADGVVFNSASAISNVALVTDSVGNINITKPSLQVSKTVTSLGPYTFSNIISFNVEVSNTSDVNLTNVKLTDTLQSSIFNIEDVYDLLIGGVTIPPNETYSISYDYRVTANDVLVGSLSNAAVVDSSVPTVTATVDDIQIYTADILINKEIEAPGPYTIDDTITYLISVINPNAIEIYDVTLTDTLQQDISILSDPYNLFTGNTTIPANTTAVVKYNYTVTQDDLSTGTVSNSAFVVSLNSDAYDMVDGIEILEPGNISISKNLISIPPTIIRPADETLNINGSVQSLLTGGSLITTNIPISSFIYYEPKWSLLNDSTVKHKGSIGGLQIDDNVSCTESSSAGLYSQSLDFDIIPGTVANTQRLSTYWTAAAQTVCGPGVDVNYNTRAYFTPRELRRFFIRWGTFPNATSFSNASDFQGQALGEDPWLINITDYGTVTARKTSPTSSRNAPLSVLPTKYGNPSHRLVLPYHEARITFEWPTLIFRATGNFTTGAGAVGGYNTSWSPYPYSTFTSPYTAQSIEGIYDDPDYPAPLWPITNGYLSGPQSSGIDFYVHMDEGEVSGEYSRGDLLVYKVVLENTGGMPVSEIELRDTLPDITIVEGQELFDGGVTLAGYTSAEAVYTRRVTSDDVFNKTAIDNTAIVNTSLGSKQDTSSISNIYRPRPGELSVTKTISEYSSDPVRADVGDILTYKLEITNVGELPVRDINIEDNRVDSNILDLYQGATINQDEKLTILYPYVITSTDTYDLSAIENTVCVTGLTGGDYSGEVPERTLPVCDEARFTYFNQPRPFTTEWEVETEGVVDFRLQYHSNINATRNVPSTGTKLEYDFTIDWGDGTDREHYTQSERHYSEDGALISHTYPTHGDPTQTYEIRIWGTFPSWALTTSSKQKITKQLAYGETGLCLNALYYGCSNFVEFNAGSKKIPLDIVVGGTTGTTTPRSLYRTFGYTGLTSFSFDQWDVSDTYDDIWNLYGTFEGCTNLTSIDTTHIQNGDIRDLTKTFYKCTNLAAVDVTNWDVSNCGRFLMLFRDCVSLASPNCSLWNFNRCIDTSFMFSNTRFTTLDTSNWYFPVFNTGGIGSFGTSTAMFNSCINLTTLDLTNWGDMSRVTTRSMFTGCGSINNLDTRNWKITTTGEGRYQNNMFKGCGSLEYLNTDNWFTTGNLNNLHGMFEFCSSLKSQGTDISTQHPHGINVSNWNVSNVVDAAEAFAGCRALTTLDVSSWNWTKTTRLENLFQGCIDLIDPIDISGWDMSKVTSITGMFNGCQSITTLDVSSWDTSSITGMNSPFGGCISLVNCDYSGFNITSVPDNYYSPTRLNSFFSGPDVSTNQKVLADAYVNWYAQKLDAEANSTPFPHKTAFNVGSLRFDTTHNPNATAARAALDGPAGFNVLWNLTDGGSV